jgi:hypothetical protein
MAMRKQTKKQAAALALQQHVSTLAELLATLDALAAIPAEPCPACGRDFAHYRCKRCNSCQEEWTLGVCSSCRAKPSRVVGPLRRWEPRLCFAAEFGRDLAAKIRRGMVPRPKQVALAARLAAEDHTRKPTTTERPALAFLTPKSPAWRHVLALVERDAFCLAPQYLDQDRPDREDVAAVRAAASAIIGDRTGYDTLVTTGDYADALKVASGDAVLEAALYALLDVHAWVLRERKATEAEAA